MLGLKGSLLHINASICERIPIPEDTYINGLLPSLVIR